MIYTVKALPHLSGQATWAFCVHKFSSKQENFCGKPYFASFACTSRVECEIPARLLRVFYVRKLRIRCGQHTCTARYGHVNSVVNARELCARCEETWMYKNERFYPILGNHLSVLINQNDFQILQKTLLISEIIYRYWKLLSDIGNYFPKSWNTGQMSFDVPDPLYWHCLTLIRAWISNHVPGFTWDELSHMSPNSKGVKRNR